MAGDGESLLRANAHNVICNHAPWAPADREQSGLETLEESLGLVDLRKELKE